MIRRPPRSPLSSSSAASDVYKRQVSTQSTGVVGSWKMAISAAAAAGLVRENRMISSTEERVRMAAGVGMTAAVLLSWGWLDLAPGYLAAGLSSGIGVFNTGFRSQ
eukprot:TRINITY_DN216_c0_g1_i3.p2 TRINITY_DN216_c0_g1~~TRINITY_DN216_c0_g1_i3.p2  ORF type:complete len:106 (+),score=21.46 TRINITY_DN216_c0_g1_i3:84-401(+)